MYYKATLIKKPTIEFKVEKISDEDAYAKTCGIFYFGSTDSRERNIYSIRKTKKGAINALKKEIHHEIVNLHKVINRLEKVFDYIN